MTDENRYGASVDSVAFDLAANPGLKRTVALLRASGFVVSDGDDGEGHDPNCDCGDGPYVTLVVEPERAIEEADRLYHLLASRGISVPEIVDDVHDVFISANYDPSTKTCIIDVCNMCDALLPAELLS